MKYEYNEKSWYNNKYKSPLFLAFFSDNYLEKFNGSQDGNFPENLMKYKEITGFLLSKNFVRARYFYNEPTDASFLLFLFFLARTTVKCSNDKCIISYFPFNLINKLIDKYDVKMTDSNENTIFHYLAMCSYHSCESFQSVVRKVFVKYKDLRTSLNKYGDSPLHFTCNGRNEWFVKELLDSGVSLKFINEPGRNGPILQRYLSLNNNDPCATIVQYIISKGGSHDLTLSHVHCDQKIIPKLFIIVVGDSGVGKTTLLNNLKCYTNNAFVQSDSSTHGFVPVTITENDHCYQFYDFAGQIEYSEVQLLFLRDLLSSTSNQPTPASFVFLIVVKANENGRKIEEQITRWMSFLQGFIQSVKITAQAMLLYSHADQKVSDDQNSLLALSEVISKNFIESLDISDTLICMDCRTTGNKVAELSKTKKLIKSFEEMCSRSEGVPLSPLALELKSHLGRFSAAPCQFRDVMQLIRKKLSFSFADGKIKLSYCSLLSEVPELMESPLKELHIQNYIMLQKPSKDCMSWWIIPKAVQEDLFSKASALFCKASSANLTEQVQNTGVIPISKLENTFKSMKANFEFSVFLSYLKDMEYCRPIESDLANQIFSEDTKFEGDYLFFPGLVNSSRKDSTYALTDKSNCRFFFSMLLHTKGRLSLHFLHNLLLRLTFQHSERMENILKRRMSLWINGIYWSSKDGVEISVEVQEYKDVIVLARGLNRKNVAKHASSVLSEILNVEENLLDRGEQCPPLEKYCLYPIPKDWDSFNQSSERIQRIPISEMMDKFMENPDSRSYFLNEDGTPPVPFGQLLPVEPYILLKKETLKELRSSSPCSEHLLKDEYIRGIWEDNSCTTYEDLCNTLDLYSIFKGKNLADGIRNKFLSQEENTKK